MAAALLLQACSSRPREFEPALAAAPASQADFDAAYANCHKLMVEGKLDSNGRLGSAATGAAATAATAVAGGMAASSAGLYAGAAVASATVVALPFVAIAGAFSMAKIKRGKKERAIKTAMTGCLDQHGHKVTGWTRAKKVAASGAAPATGK